MEIYNMFFKAIQQGKPKMQKQYTDEQFERYVKFITVAQDRGGYRYGGDTRPGLPTMFTFSTSESELEEMPKPTIKVLMQGWRSVHEDRDELQIYKVSPVGKAEIPEYWTKAGSAFIVEFPDESDDTEEDRELAKLLLPRSDLEDIS